MRTRGVRRWFTALAVLAIVAAGCGDDDDSDAEGTGGGDTTTTAAQADVDSPEGEPIRFVVAAATAGVVGQPEIFDGADAAVEAINGAGGIVDPAGGPNRPLEVVRCEGEEDPDAALHCAQDTIPDGIVAVVGRYLFGADGTQAWAQAGIPMVGTLPVEAEDYINDHVFPISGGAPVGAPSVAITVQEAGAERVALVTGDVDAGRILADLIRPALDDPDDLVNQTYLPLDPSADYTSQLAQLAGINPDGVLLFGSTDINIRVISGLRSSGYTGLIGIPGTGLGADGLETLGDAAEGLLVAGAYESPDDSGAAIDQFNEEMDAHGGDAARTEFALNAWASVHLFADVLADVDTIDAASVLAALPGREVDLGVAPPFTLGTPDNPFSIPRIFRATFQPQEVRDGEIVATGDGEFLDLNNLIAG